MDERDRKAMTVEELIKAYIADNLEVIKSEINYKAKSR